MNSENFQGISFRGFGVTLRKYHNLYAEIKAFKTFELNRDVYSEVHLFFVVYFWKTISLKHKFGCQNVQNHSNFHFIWKLIFLCLKVYCPLKIPPLKILMETENDMFKWISVNFHWTLILAIGILATKFWSFFFF